MKDYLFMFLYVLFIILIISFAIFWIITYMQYKDVPIAELPTWVAWLLFKN